MKTFPAGRMNDAPSIGLSASLAAAGFKLGRLQTGTPVRLDATTINFTGMEKQLGDTAPSPFSYLRQDVPNAVCVVGVSRKTHRLCYYAGESGRVLSDTDDS